MDKKQIRKTVREKKQAMTPEEIEIDSWILCRLFLQTEAYAKAKTLYAYLPYNQEVRILPILEQALQDGKRVAVPKVFGEEMKFLYMTDLSRVAPGYFGIPEPVDDGPVADDENALVLMPGVAFDEQGHRIGYGGGFYDRFLEKEPSHPTVALCYEFQMFPHLETEAHDHPVDQVIHP